jgi:hypothetical protein
MKKVFDGIGTYPKWWTLEMLRSYLFVVAYLNRREDLVPSILKEQYSATLRLLPIMSDEFVKACTAPRNRFMRVRWHSFLH